MGNALRVPPHTDEQEADEALQSLLDHVKATSGDRLLNLHRQMAIAPAVLAGYMGIRDALAAYSTADSRTRSAITVAASAANNGAYTLAINSRLATRDGWSQDQIAAIADGYSSGDAKLDAVLAVTREAVVGDGTVAEGTWTAALDAGWSPELLVEAFAHVGLVTYCDRFVRYAETEFDI